MTYYIAIVYIPETWTTKIRYDKQDYNYYDGSYLAMSMIHPITTVRVSSSFEDAALSIVEIYKTKIKEMLEKDPAYDLSKLTLENMEKTIKQFIDNLPNEDIKNSPLIQFSIKQIEIE